MAAPGLTIPTAFTAKGDYASQVNRNINVTDKWIGTLSRLNSIGKGAGLSDITKNVLGYAKSALLVGGAFATARFSATAITDYETAIQSLQAVTGAGNGQMVGFKKQIEELGGTSKKSMVDVAKSFEVVGSMMSQYLEDPKALRMITEAGITLSKASRMELEPAMQSMTSVMNQFQIGAEGANKTIQQLTAGEIVGSVHTAEAAQYLQEFGAVAKNMSVNVGESVALIEALGIQMDKSKIGVGARNILTSIGAAGGLDKKARTDLRKAGVDMNYLMDTSHSLSERLHELSKIATDPVKMISVFGKENVTAASVIFNQLGTYDKFYDRIQRTSEAENQAATNSKTFSIALDQLKNRWANLLNTSSAVGSVLDKFRDGLFYVADHMEGIISIALKVGAAFAIWKGVIFATQSALVTFRTVSQALFLVDMVKYVSVTKGITGATAAWEIAQQSLNGALLANPIALVAIAATALIGGLILLDNEMARVTQAAIKQRDLNLTAHYDSQTDALKKQVKTWQDLGYSIHDATIKALKFDTMRANKGMLDANINVKSKEDKYLNAYNEAWFPNNSATVDAAKEELNMAKQRQTEAMYQQRGNTDNVIRSANSGIINQDEFLSIFKSPGKEDNFSAQRSSAAPTALDNKSLQNIKATEQFLKETMGQSGTAVSQKLEVVIRNDGGSVVDVKSGKTAAKSVMPNTKSSFSTN